MLLTHQLAHVCRHVGDRFGPGGRGWDRGRGVLHMIALPVDGKMCMVKVGAIGKCRCMHTLSKLEHVLEAVDDFQAAGFGELAHIPRVEEALGVCTHKDAHVIQTDQSY